MVRAKGTVEVGVPAEALWALLADPTRIPAWRPDIAEVRVESASRYAEVISFFGRQEQTFEVTASEQGRRWEVRAVAGMALRPVQRFRFDPTPGGTRLTWDVELPVPLPFAPMWPLLAWMIPSKWRGYAVGLKALAERDRS